MANKIDKETVFQMLKTGFSRRTIAKRLDCSERQIQRLAKGFEKAKNRKFKKDNNLSDPEVEMAVRDHFLKLEPVEQTAKRFGISKQALIK